eukprot:scpid99237/ scgid2078/ 
MMVCMLSIYNIYRASSWQADPNVANQPQNESNPHAERRDIIYKLFRFIINCIPPLQPGSFWVILQGALEMEIGFFSFAQNKLEYETMLLGYAVGTKNAQLVKPQQLGGLQQQQQQQ